MAVSYANTPEASRLYGDVHYGGKRRPTYMYQCRQCSYSIESTDNALVSSRRHAHIMVMHAPSDPDRKPDSGDSTMETLDSLREELDSLRARLKGGN